MGECQQKVEFVSGEFLNPKNVQHSGHTACLTEVSYRGI